MSQDEARLIQQAKEGDPEAFTAIYDRHQPSIYRYVYYRVNDVSTAQDLTGDVFVRLVERIDQFTYRGRPLVTWLYTIARNLVADHHRRVGRRRQLDLDEQLVADTIHPEAAAEIGLTQDRLAAALACLTEGQCQVIVLKFVEGYNNEAVAQMLNKPVGAVKSLQHRALVRLRGILESDDS